MVPLLGFELVFLTYHLVEASANARENFTVAVSDSKKSVDCAVL